MDVNVNVDVMVVVVNVILVEVNGLKRMNNDDDDVNNNQLNNLANTIGQDYGHCDQMWGLGSIHQNVLLDPEGYIIIHRLNP